MKENARSVAAFQESAGFGFGEREIVLSRKSVRNVDGLKGNVPVRIP